MYNELAIDIHRRCSRSSIVFLVIIPTKMPTCCVPGCSSSDRTGSSLHRLPSDQAMRSEWLKVIGVTGTVLQPVVCSQHFEENQFYSVVHGKPYFVLCFTMPVVRVRG